jgi:hypothetical protein
VTAHTPAGREALSTAAAAGATLLKPTQKVEWGGSSGYFTDPDGPAPEVAYPPFPPLRRHCLRRAVMSGSTQLDQVIDADGCRCGDTQ